MIEMMVLAMIASVVLKRGVEDVIHAAKGGTPARYAAASARRKSGAAGRYWSQLWDDVWTDASVKRAEKRAGRTSPSSRPRGAATSFFAGLFQDGRRAAGRSWEQGWVRLDEKRREKATRPRPGQVTIPGTVVPNIQDESRPQDEDDYEDELPPGARIVEDEDGRTDLVFGDDKTDPTGVSSCPECGGTGTVAGEVCPSCLVRQAQRNYFHESGDEYDGEVEWSLGPDDETHPVLPERYLAAMDLDDGENDWPAIWEQANPSHDGPPSDAEIHWARSWLRSQLGAEGEDGWLTDPEVDELIKQHYGSWSRFRTWVQPKRLTDESDPNTGPDSGPDRQEQRSQHHDQQDRPRDAWQVVLPNGQAVITDHPEIYENEGYPIQAVRGYDRPGGFDITDYPTPAPPTTQEGPTMTATNTEVTGLESGIKFAETSADAYSQMVTCIEATMAVLSSFDVGGPAHQAAALGMEASQNASLAMASLATELKKHRNVAEAIDATPGAGKREFYTAGR